MRYLILLLGSLFVLNAQVFYAKLEPIESYVVKSAVGGKVIYSNESIEGKFAKNELIIEFDSELDRLKLKQTQEKLKAIESMLEIEKKNYDRIKKVSTKSDLEKDSQMIKVINYEAQIADLIISIETLKDQIKNKKLFEKNRYITSVSVKKDDYVNAGTLLYEASDLSKGKLEIFLPVNEADDYLNKTIYLDDKMSDLKINKIYKVADTKHISSYKCEIIVDKPSQFSRLIKIDFK